MLHSNTVIGVQHAHEVKACDRHLAQDSKQGSAWKKKKFIISLCLLNT